MKQTTSPSSSLFQMQSGGYIALMATIIISAILLVLSVEGSLAGFHARYNILGTEAKEQAASLAQGCADQALSAIVTDPSYTGNATTTTAAGSCYVFPVAYNSPVAGVVTIRAQSNVRGSFANLEMQINMSQIHIDSIPETPTKGTLVIITNVVNDGSGSSSPSNFTMSVSGSVVSTSSFAGVDSGQVVTVDPGAYSVTGSADTNYARTSSSNCSGSITTGAIKFCTITYNDITTTLTVLATIINDTGGSLQTSGVTVKIDGSTVPVGETVTLLPGAHTVTAVDVLGYTKSAWGYQCAADGTVNLTPGETKTCIINFNDSLPPSPSCADTVMMLDRSGSMFSNSSDIPNEKIAAKSLAALYSTVTPLPKISVGRFGDVATGISAEIIAQLTDIYTGLASIIDNGLPQNPLSYTNIADAITVGSNELSSVRHTAGKQKVLIIVSDGEPNRPVGTTTSTTGFLSATSSMQEASSSIWVNASGAYSKGGATALAGADGSSHRERYDTFSFGGGAGLPSGVTVVGIQAQVDAWATALTATTAASVTKSPVSATTPSQWSNPTASASSDNSYATSAVNGSQQSFTNFGFSIPGNAVITGVLVTGEAHISGGTPQTTSLLLPFAQGFHTAWANGKATVDEAGTPDCTSADSIISTSNNSRESITLDLATIPNGSLITDVTITAYDRGDSVAGGTYRTFARLNGSDTDAPGVALTATNFGNTSAACVAKTQPIDVPDVVKSGTTTFEIGVVKVPNSNNAVRVGALRATITYLPPVTGSYDVALSSDTGSTYSAAKSVSLTSSVDSVASPTGNSATDLWNRTWKPEDFANGSLVVRVQNNTLTGPVVALDQLSVAVSYVVPAAIGTACTLGVDISWDGGTTWSTEMTQTLNNLNTAYLLGGATNLWSTHTWVPSDFSDANFRARVHAIDPGSACASGAVEQLDWLQFKVYSTKFGEPIQASLDAADTAKRAGIDIFTIHFGSDPGPYVGKKLLANLANGTVAVAGHEAGSEYVAASSTIGDTTLRQPAAVYTPNQFTNPANGYLSDNVYATDAVNGDAEGYGAFNLTIPPLSVVKGIEVSVEAKSSDNNGCQIGVELSSNGGSTFTSVGQTNTLNGNNDSISVFGGATSLWNRAWLTGDFTNPNYVVRITNIDPGNQCTNGSLLSVDQIRTRIYYTTADPENADNDNFFVAPTSVDMKSIFDYIGARVCPALNYTAPSTPPTTGSLKIVTQVINNNGGSLVASAVSMVVTPGTASPNSFAGSGSGVDVTLQPGSYLVKSAAIPTGYIEVTGAGCSSIESGAITAGENRICVMTYDDIPPPPPPPDVTIHLGQWKELPVAN